MACYSNVEWTQCVQQEGFLIRLFTCNKGENSREVNYLAHGYFFRKFYASSA